MAKIINKLNVKKRELSNMLEQIGKEDAMFNDDKLITNIKIEAIEDTLNHNDIISQDTDNSFISKRTTKTSYGTVKAAWPKMAWLVVACLKNFVFRWVPFR